jgi:hypothetical protein
VARRRAAEPITMVSDDHPVEPDEVADAETGIS